MKRILITSLVLGLVGLGGLAYPHASRSGSGVAQKRGSRRPAAKPTVRQTRIDYSKFLHRTEKHKQACNTCHKVPTGNWRKVRDYPDIVDYPGHSACVSCHRSQFFKGAKPPICSVCHSKVSPKDDVRFAFRNPAAQRQFTIGFPHDKHQDVIARLFLKFPKDARSVKGVARTHDAGVFVRASFTSSAVIADDQSRHYKNCELCHGPRNAPSPPASGWVDGFVPDNLTYKSEPVSHGSCFSCHWKSEPPVNDNCAGCHKLAIRSLAGIDFSKRISVKFRHGREQHIAECTTCHINITGSSLINGLKPDVPISSCTECHNKAGQREDLNKELLAIDKNPAFVCVYCHTSDIGRLDPPSGHYLIAERPPVKRKDPK